MQDFTKEAEVQNMLKLQKDEFSLPPLDALDGILSDRPNVHGQIKANPQPPYRPGSPTGPEIHSQTNPTETSHSQTVHEKRSEPCPADDTEHQATDQELENYRKAVSKMAEDILALRKQVGSLDMENNRLRSELRQYHDLGRGLLDDTDVDVMTKAEIADCIASLKLKLVSENSRAAVQKDKIQQLQNELIRKNDSEKILLQVQQAQQQEKNVVQRYQSRLAKMENLEATVRQQEKVIEKLEQALNVKLAEKTKGKTNKTKKLTGEDDQRKFEVEAALTVENSHLRAELEKLRTQLVVINQPVQAHESFKDTEKLDLMGQLEATQARVSTLEKQLEENSWQWGREREDFLTRLNEYAHGFTRTSVVLHDLPLVHTPPPTSGISPV